MPIPTDPVESKRLHHGNPKIAVCVSFERGLGVPSAKNQAASFALRRAKEGISLPLEVDGPEAMACAACCHCF